MKSMKYFIHTSLCTLFLLSSVSLSAQTYTLGLVEWLPWSTAYVAAEKGFWKDAGINVKVRRFSDYETENLRAFENGQTDFMMSMIGSAVEILNRNPGKFAIIYEHDWSHGGDLFIAAKNIADVAGLKGKKIGLYSRAAPISFFASKVLAGAGLTVDDVRLIEIANTADLNEAFRRGRLDAIISYDPEASKVVKDGTGKLLFTSADFPGVIPEGISVQKKLLDESPETITKFLRGWLRAVQWQSDPANRAEFYTILKRTMFKGGGYSDADLDSFAAGGKIHTDLKDIQERNTNGVQSFLGELLAYLEKKGDKINSTTPDDYVQTAIAVGEAKKLFAVTEE